MTPGERRVRHAVYIHFRDRAAPPGVRDLAAATGLGEPEVRRALTGLADRRLLVLGPDGVSIRMAHPFAGAATGYRSLIDGVAYDANCAWDALAIPALLDRDADIPGTCRDCGEPFDLTVRDGRVSPDSGVVQFIVPAARFWDDVEDT